MNNQYKKVLRFGRGEKNHYDKKLSIISFFENSVDNYSDKVALRYGKKTLTYKQLDEKANRLANYLLLINIQPADKIAIYLEPCLDLIVSLIAILKIGCCYIPLDVNYPVDRLQSMLANSMANLLITHTSIADKVPTMGIKFFCIDKKKRIITKQHKDRPKIKLYGKSLAYIIYTSGSTGIPKGVPIHHTAINNHMLWMKECFKFNSSDVILLKTPTSFDPSVWEIFLPLYCGAELVIAPAGSYLNPLYLAKLIKKHSVTTIQFVPSLFYEFLKCEASKKCASLTRIFCGGESLKLETKKLFFSRYENRVTLINLYGPTEATIQVTWHIVSTHEIKINEDIIGKPIFNVQLYVLNKYLVPVKPGIEGELYITGDCLTKGYYNNTKSTIKRFVDNPFVKNSKNKLYKTGDLVKWSESGSLIYVGRNNEQIKINGVRIEPAEIVSHILKNESVSDSVIIKKTNSNYHAFLACYLVLKKDHHLDTKALHHSLKKFFPNSMLPKTYTIIESLPLTVNGKLDKFALPNLKNISSSPPDNSLHILSSTEKILLSIWKELLTNTEIKIQDNFFDVGGHSLLAFRLITEIETQLKVLLHIKDIFLFQTIRELSKHIDELRLRQQIKNKCLLFSDSIIPLQTKGNGIPLFLIHPVGGTVFWYSNLAKLTKNRPIYGIQDPSIELKKNIFSDIEQMADIYLSMIKKIQPQGPYFIGGASFGATVAVEISKKLFKNSDVVLSIPILDGWGVYPNTLRNNGYFEESMLRQHEDLKMQFSKYNFPHPEEILYIQWQRLNMLWDYNLPKVRSPLLLFKSKELLPSFQEIDEPYNHWRQFTKMPIKRFLVGGNHETMFQFPHVSKLAKILYSCLDEIDKSA